jgi:hypothetical protein
VVLDCKGEAVTYLFGYQGKRYTLAQMEQFDTWNKVNPEFRERILCMIDQCPHDLGIGSGWRSSETQERVFTSRYVPFKEPPGIYWDGQYWRKKEGVAPAAPPGRSYHESTDPKGYALAVDLLNYNPAIGWANANDRAYGVNDFAAVNDEAWHYQPLEIPTARRNYNPAVHVLQNWKLPTAPPQTKLPTPPGRPVFKEGATDKSTVVIPGAPNGRVSWLQTILRDEYVKTIVVDGQFGPKTTAALKVMQTKLRVVVDGIYGPQTAGARLTLEGK